MNKKGFVLIETIVVIIVVSVALLTLFSSYYNYLNKMNSENRYDNPEYLYMTYYVKEKLIDLEKTVYYSNLPVFDFSKRTNNLIDYSNINNVYNLNEVEELKKLTNVFNIKNIYLITGLNSEEQNFKQNLNKFNAYVISYLQTLDVSSNDTILIVEYNRIEKDEILDDKLIYCSGIYENKYCKTITDNKLKKTYIASLKW